MLFEMMGKIDPTFKPRLNENSSFVNESNESVNLKNFAEMHGLKILPVNFKFQGVSDKRKGFDLVDADGNIQITLEPKSYGNDSMYSKDKWLVSDKSNKKSFYISSLRELSKITGEFVGHTGFKRELPKENNFDAGDVSGEEDSNYDGYVSGIGMNPDLP